MMVLQEQLIAAKDDQLNELKETVGSSVGDTFQTHLKSYSEAVHGSRNGCSSSGSGSLLDQKSVVKDVVVEEDRSRNLLIFGLEKEPEEKISEKVGQVLEELGETPKLEANRIGHKAKQQTPRPVKVSVSHSIVVSQILSKARKIAGI